MNYGYVRISTPRQNIDRQVRNILAVCPDAKILSETYTRTNFYGRKEWSRLMQLIRPGDNIYFDSVSRMSGDKEEGFLLYQNLYEKGVNLYFIREPHINTDTYKAALNNLVSLTGTSVDFILDGVNKYLLVLAKEQIRLAFSQSEKEISDLRQRTKEGIETARLKGKQIGQKSGSTFETKKSIEAKKIILKHNKDFGGNLTNEETWCLAKISKMTFYKYKKELLETR